MSTYGTTEYNERFGERLRAQMYERGKPPAMMAKDLKISKGSISNWTTGKCLPRPGAMDAICRYLNCTRADLLEDPPQTVQESSGAPRDAALGLVLDAIESAGYGHLKGIVEAAAQADEGCYDFVIGILKRNPKKS